MLILLPPSETKRDGGIDGSRLDLSALRYPKLTGRRRTVLRALRAVSADPDSATKALKLGAAQLRDELHRNRTVLRSPVLPAIDRFSGVLYDALNAASLPDGARDYLGRHALVHSALFGLVGGLDPIPAHRLSAGSRLPGLSLKQTWSDALSTLLAAEPGPILDLRSEAYAALGPAPARADTRFVRVVTDSGRALNHFNKHSKGLFVRDLALAGATPSTIPELIDWAASADWTLRDTPDGELHLLARP